jgi:2,4-dienoyl-CoA reductase-like NADH-dependent reductase (Old Yellow Enzyme family)
VRAAFPEERPVLGAYLRIGLGSGGWDVEQSIELARQLEAEVCTPFTCHPAAYHQPSRLPLNQATRSGLHVEIKEAVSMPVIAVGLITEPEQAENVITQGEADAVALARAMLYDPRWPWHAAASLGAQVSAPPQYWRSPPHGVRNLFKMPPSVKDEAVISRCLQARHTGRHWGKSCLS